MKKFIIFYLLFSFLCLSENYRDRFLWIFGFNLTKDGDVENIISLIKKSSENGYNGIVLSGGLDSLCKQSKKYLENIEKIKMYVMSLMLKLYLLFFLLDMVVEYLVITKILQRGSL